MRASGRYRRLHLPERFGGAHLPHVEAIDMRREGPPRGRFISPRLAEAVQIALEKKEQALLFLNRRGYAPLTLCRACGYRLQCPNCDAWLVDHRFKRRLVCHHCGFSMPPPNECPQCHAADSFAAVGPGVERLQQEAAELFPEARILVLSSDLVELIERLRAGTRRRRRRPLRSHHRHAARRQGPSFPQAQSGRHRRCRSRAGQRRSARGRAHLPDCCIRWSAAPAARRAAASAILQTHQPEHPVMQALISGRPRGVLFERDRAARAHRLSAVRPARGSWSSRAAERHTAESLRQGAGGAARRRMSKCACWVRRKRRSRWCAGAIVSAFWSRRRAISTCRNYLRGLAGACAEDQGQLEAGSGRRSAELLLGRVMSRQSPAPARARRLPWRQRRPAAASGLHGSRHGARSAAPPRNKPRCRSA